MPPPQTGFGYGAALNFFAEERQASRMQGG